MIEAFLTSFFVTTILLIWLETNAFVEYFKFLKIVKQYNKAQEAGINSTFINFLSINYNSFFVRLITCPYCLGFWITLLSIIFVNWKFFAFIYILSIVYYKLILILSKYGSR